MSSTGRTLIVEVGTRFLFAPSRCFLEGFGTRKVEVGVTYSFLCYFPWSTCTELDCLTESIWRIQLHHRQIPLQQFQ